MLLWAFGWLVAIANAACVQQSTEVVRVINSRPTEWLDSTSLTFPQFDPSLGVLDFIRITMTWEGNATFQYSYSELEDGEREVYFTTLFTPQLVSTLLGLSYPATLLNTGDYNLVLSTFNRDFEPSTVYNKAYPQFCPNQNDPNSCDANRFEPFVGFATADITSQTVLNSFVGNGNIAVGGRAGGSATGRLSPSTGNTIRGSLTVGATVSLQYFWTNIGLEKRVNTQLQRQQPGVLLASGSAVTFTYNVTNFGTAPLSNIVIVDDRIASGDISCPAVLGACSSVLCTATQPAVEGNYTNTASCLTTGKDGHTHPCPTDRANYFGAAARLQLHKFTNGFRPDAGYIIQGAPVTWVYEVTNTGTVALTAVTVTDNDSTLSARIVCPGNALGSGSVMLCSATGTAIVGAYSNIGSVHGVFPPLSLEAVSTDASTYTGNPASISIRKFTNGVDTHAVNAQEPIVAVGGAVTWTYEVTNSGNSLLSAVEVRDNRFAGFASCPLTILAPGSGMVCSATGVAIRDRYVNVGSASGVSDLAATVGVEAATVRATGDSSYFGAAQQISIVKLTNDANVAVDGTPDVLLGDAVTWKYVVSNPGNVALTSIAVSDNRFNDIPIVCPQDSLQPSASIVCSAMSSANTVGSYSNVGSVRGVYALFGTPSTATASSGYFGIQQAISVAKRTNGVLVGGSTAAPFIQVGGPVTWTYTVTNLGNTDLTAVGVSDDRLAPGSVACPSVPLAPSSSLVCTAVGVAAEGEYSNTATAHGVSRAAQLASVGVARATVTATASSSYFGLTEGLFLNKLTNDFDIRSQSVPALRAGSPVTWKYEITNAGNEMLVSVVVTDDVEGAVTCGSSSLGNGATMVCSVVGVAQATEYHNVASVHAQTLLGSPVSATSPSSYHGFNPTVSLVKRTNGVDVRSTQGVGPYVLSGTPVTWSYTVTNTGVGGLSSIVVLDEHTSSGVVPVCGFTDLAAGSSGVCTASGAAVDGSYSNLAAVTGLNNGVNTSAESSSNYFGVVHALSLAKTTNGADPETSPLVLAGRPVTWRYAVTNHGNTPLTSLRVQDNRFAQFASCPSTTLQPAGTVTCAVTGLAQSGDYTNVGTATAVSPLGPGVGTVLATSTSGYKGVIPNIEILVYTNGGHYESQSEGPQLNRSSPVTWTYAVRNTGNIDLTAVTVTDDQVGPIACPDMPDPLVINGTHVCEFVGVSSAHPYKNVGVATGSALQASVSDSDATFHNPVTVPGVKLIKRTNGIWTRDQPIPALRVDSVVTWTYEVTNTGEVELVNVAVTDDLVAPQHIHCPAATLSARQHLTCWATGLVVDCLYSNVGCVNARGITGGNPVSDCSQSSYIGKTAGVSLTKFTNHFPREVLGSAPGPCIETGDPVWWHYVVSNVGDDLLTGIKVTDDKLTAPGSAPLCPDTCLEPWHSMTCKAHGKAVSGPYTNLASVTATPAHIGGGDVGASDRNHYRGVRAQVRLDIKVNGAHESCGADEEAEARGEGCEAEGEGESNQGKGEGGHHGKDGYRSRALLSVPERNDRLRGGASGEGGKGDSHSNGEGPKQDRPQKRRCRIGEGEGCDLPRWQERRKCNAPVFGLGAPLEFTFVISNTGTEELLGVTLTFENVEANGGLAYVPFTPADVNCPATVLAASAAMTCTSPSFVNNQYGRQSMSAKVTASGQCLGQCVQNRDENYWFTAEGEGERGGGHGGEGEGRADGRPLPTSTRTPPQRRDGEGEGRHRGSRS